MKRKGGEKMGLAIGQDNFVWGKDNPKGLHLNIEWGEGWAKCHWKATRDYIGWSNVIHGGILTTILDDMMGPPTRHLNVKVVTAHLEVDFRAPAHVGDELDFKTWLAEYGGRKSVKMGGRIMRGETVIAEAKAVMVIMGTWAEGELEALDELRRNG